MMLGILVFGVMAYQVLPVADLPRVDFPTIRCQASLPGASPETMAASVALPLEKQFTSIAGVTSINSTSTQGGTDITIQFDINRNIDAAAQDVQSMIGRAARQLPPEMPSPPSYQKVNPADQSVFFIVLRSSTLPLSVLDEIAQTQVAQRISMVSGVAQVNVFGSQKFAVRVDVDPRELGAIDRHRRGGRRHQQRERRTCRPARSTADRACRPLQRPADARGRLWADGHRLSQRLPVRLDEVAHVYDGVENDKTASWQNGACATSTCRCRSSPDGTWCEPWSGSRRCCRPSASSCRRRSRSTSAAIVAITIRESVHDVKLTLMLTVALVVLVIFLFLRNLSATIIPSLALPVLARRDLRGDVSLNYSLDNLSLMALTLSVGFVVDDAIVMLENIVRHMEMGKNAMQAAFDGSKEVAFTICR